MALLPNLRLSLTIWTVRRIKINKTLLDVFIITLKLVRVSHRFGTDAQNQTKPYFKPLEINIEKNSRQQQEFGLMLFMYIQFPSVQNSAAISRAVSRMYTRFYPSNFRYFNSLPFFKVNIQGVHLTQENTFHSIFYIYHVF